MPVKKSTADAWNALSADQRDEALKQMTPDEEQRLATELGWGGHATGLSAQPGILTVKGLKDRAMEFIRRGSSYLPAAGGTVGGIVGGSVGTPADIVSGPVGTAVGAVGGSAIGGAAGEAVRQGVLHATGLDKYEEPLTAGERAVQIAKEAATQGAAELLGQGAGKMLRPTLQRTIAKLYYAGGIGAHDNNALESVFQDIAMTERLQGNKATTVQGFVNVLNQAKRNIGNEVDLSMAQKVSRGDKMVPLGDAEANTAPIAERIKELIAAHPSRIKWDKTGLTNIKKRAMQYSKPETFRNLTDRRIILNENLSAMYSLPPGEQRAYLLAHPELEIDKAEADAIRDVVYPEMDHASGRPLGTTAKLQQRRGAIMGLSNTVQKHLDQLQVKTKTLAGAPVWERGNISTYGTTSGRPGVAVHRLSSLLRTPNPEKAANKRVASAFGHTVGSKIATPLATKPGMDVMALPVRYLAAPEAPLEAPEEEEQMPSISDLRQQAGQLNPQ